MVWSLAVPPPSGALVGVFHGRTTMPVKILFLPWVAPDGSRPYPLSASARENCTRVHAARRLFFAQARGLTSLWGDAVKQTPPGDACIVYVSYEEGARALVANRRTDRILTDAAQWTQHWTANIPLVVINRL